MKRLSVSLAKGGYAGRLSSLPSFAAIAVSAAVLTNVAVAETPDASAVKTVAGGVVFTDPESSILWKTVSSGNLEIPVPAWPESAASATLAVSGENFPAKTFTVTSPDESFVLSLSLPDEEKAETMLSFTLSYAKDTGDVLESETRCAMLGFVRGAGNGTAARCIPGGESSKEWFFVRSQQAVLPVSEDFSSLKIDGADISLPQAPGWYLWKSIARGDHALSAVANEVELGGTYRRIGDNFVFIVK